MIGKILDFNQDIYVAYTEFPVGEFAEKIRQKHPEWKFLRQWYNPRYWQPTARKKQREEEQKAIRKTGLTFIMGSPEAQGVNITGLMKNIGINLGWKWPPEHNLENEAYLKNKTYLVSLIGHMIL